jgi:hypothetical protein
MLNKTVKVNTIFTSKILVIVGFMSKFILKIS